MRDRNPHFDRRQRGSEGRVHIAHHEDRAWLDHLQDGLQASEDFGRLRRVRARADAEIDGRRLKVQLREELLRHHVIVVLAGVDEDRQQCGVALHLLDQRSDLDEVGAGARGDDDLHGRLWRDAAVSQLTVETTAGTWPIGSVLCRMDCSCQIVNTNKAQMLRL